MTVYDSRNVVFPLNWMSFYNESLWLGVWASQKPWLLMSMFLFCFMVDSQIFGIEIGDLLNIYSFQILKIFA